MLWAQQHEVTLQWPASLINAQYTFRRFHAPSTPDTYVLHSTDTPSSKCSSTPVAARMGSLVEGWDARKPGAVPKGQSSAYEASGGGSGLRVHPWEPVVGCQVASRVPQATVGSEGAAISLPRPAAMRQRGGSDLLVCAPSPPQDLKISRSHTPHGAPSELPCRAPPSERTLPTPGKAPALPTTLLYLISCSARVLNCLPCLPACSGDLEKLAGPPSLARTSAPAIHGASAVQRYLSRTSSGRGGMSLPTTPREPGSPRASTPRSGVRTCRGLRQMTLQPTFMLDAWPAKCSAALFARHGFCSQADPEDW